MPEVDTAVRSLTVMWDGSMVVAANNHGTCYVWRLMRGTQVTFSCKSTMWCYPVYQIWLLRHLTIHFSGRLWPTLSHFISCKHIVDTFSNVSFLLNFVNPTGTVSSFPIYLLLSCLVILLWFNINVISVYVLFLDIWPLHPPIALSRYGMLMVSR